MRHCTFLQVQESVSSEVFLIDNDVGCHVCNWWLHSTVTTAVYQNVLEHFIMSAADNLFGAVEFILKQDSVLAHMAKTTKEWLEERHTTVMNWCGNSPDINPIENLWAIVKRQVHQHTLSTTN